MLSQKFVQKEENVIVFFLCSKKSKIGGKRGKMCLKNLFKRRKCHCVFLCLKKSKIGGKSGKMFVRFVLRKRKFLCVIYAQGK